MVAVVAIIPKAKLEKSIYLADYDFYFVTIPKASDTPTATKEDVVKIASEKLEQLLEAAK